MSKSKVIRNSLVSVALAAVVGLAAVSTFSVSTAKADVPETEETIATTYFKDQLVPGSASVGIYETLEDMYLGGDLLTGTKTVDLVETGVLENRSYSQSVLTAEFSAGRDAFFMDYSSVFYTDGDLLTLRELTNSSGDYSITMGIGREETYFSDGFTAENAGSAENEYWNKVKEIATEADKEETYKDRVYAAYSYVAENVSYALEPDVETPGNEKYVRNPYGALIKGEACCEGYARAFKAILDVLGIPCVLVQGTFMSDNDGAQAHMWTYVRMDDNRWYMCDPTMQSKSNDKAKYFLINGRDEIMQSYQEDGMISLSSTAFDFYYPNVSGVEYTEANGDNPFKIEEYGDNGAYLKVSYNGMGYVNAEGYGVYILYSFDSGTTWYYIRGMMDLGEISEEESDFGTYFLCMTQGYEYTFAATRVEYPGLWTAFGLYTGSEGDIFDISSSFGDQVRATNMPYVVKSSAVCDGEEVSTRLSPEKTYTVSVTYSDKLSLYGAEEVSVSLMDNSYITEDDVNIRDVSWDNDRVVTFTFDTIQTYHSSLGYYFEIGELIGQESKLPVNEVGFTVVNNPVFSCPYVEGSFNTVYATTPALIADSDLSTEGWTYADGTSVSDTTPHKFTLVVSSPTAEDVESMEGALTEAGESGTIAATYEITLGLCDKQISYINGERVKVLIPFPEGYSYETLGDTTFKAYHFNSDGEAEVIECVVTESGIIIYCEAFSPFAIVATTEPQTERKAAVLSFGNGSVETDLIKVSKGESVTIEIKADEGYVIDSIVLNGVQIDSYNATEGTLEIEYSQLETVGNYIEITFVAESVAVVEADHGFHIVVTDEAEGSSGLATWELVVIIIACVVVVIGVAVVVLLLTKNRKKHMPEDDDPGESGDVTV